MKEYGMILGDFQLFRRLHFRIKNGFWCEHVHWDKGTLIDLGRRKLYRCQGCGHCRC